MTPKQIEDNLKHGDLEVIAQMVSCSPSYVYYIITGKRNRETPLGRKIMMVANNIVSSRLKLSEELRKAPQPF